MGRYLKKSQTWTYSDSNTKIKVYYRIEHFDNQQLIKVKDVPSQAEPANGNIIILFELIPIGTPSIPANSEVIVSEFKDAFLTADWHSMPQPHKITIIIVHPEGVDEETIETRDPY